MNEEEVARTSFTLRNEFGDAISGEVTQLPRGDDRPAVIICHSFMAFKDWGFFPYVSMKLAQAGFVAVTFNFSLNGVLGDGERITEFAKFERNTFSRELHDLKIVTDAISRNHLGLKGIAPRMISLLGHSRGGGIAIVSASVDERVRALVTWSAVSTFDRWSRRQKEMWQERGSLPLARDTTVSPLRLGLELLNDFTLHRERLDIKAAAASLKMPWLLLHGKADVLVDPSEAEALYERSNKRTTELVLLDHVGHLYNAASRNEDDYHTLNQILDITTHWLTQQLQ